MKPFNILLFVFASCFIVCGCAKTNNDKRNYLLGTYHLTGQAHFVFDFTGQHHEYDQPDTGSVTILKEPGSDSADYVLLQGVSEDPAGDATLLFTSSASLRIVAKMTDSTINIPYTLPVSGGDYEIDGTLSKTNGKLTITYVSRYRGTTKYSTVVSD